MLLAGIVVVGFVIATTAVLYLVACVLLTGLDDDDNPNL